MNGLQGWSECAQRLYEALTATTNDGSGFRCSSVSSGRRRSETSSPHLLPPPADGLRLHPGGGHRRRRARHGDAGGRVDDGDGVAGAGGGGLVELQGRVLTLVRRRDESRGGRVEGEGRRNLGGLLRRGALRRVACQR